MTQYGEVQVYLIFRLSDHPTEEQPRHCQESVIRNRSFVV